MQPSAEVEGRELTRLFAKAAARLEVVHRWIKPGIAVVADRSLVAQELHVEGSSYFVCFEGHLENADSLSKQRGASITLPSFSDASLVHKLLAQLYHHHGATFIAQVEGAFHLVIVPVGRADKMLMACSEGAQQAFCYAFTSSGLLAISSVPDLLPTDCLPIQLTPGHCQHGFAGSLERCSPTKPRPAGRAYAPTAASQSALPSPFLGLQESIPAQALGSRIIKLPGSMPSSGSSHYTSTNAPDEDEDSSLYAATSGSTHDTAGSYKKTRRGKRAGKNLKQRNADSEVRRTASSLRQGEVDLSRSSFDSQVSTSTAGMDWRRPFPEHPHLSISIPARPSLPVSPHRPAHASTWAGAQPTTPQFSLARSSLDTARPDASARSSLEFSRPDRSARSSSEIARPDPDLSSMAGGTWQPRKAPGRTPGGTYGTPTGSYTAPGASLSTWASMRSPRASAAVGDSPSARAQAGVQLSPRGLPDSPTSLLPRSPLVSHDGKADAAWAEADARAAQEKQPPAKRFLLTQSGDSLSDRSPGASPDFVKAPPTTPKHKQPGFTILAALPEHIPAQASPTSSRSASPFSPRDPNVPAEPQPAFPERLSGSPKGRGLSPSPSRSRLRGGSSPPVSSPRRHSSGLSPARLAAPNENAAPASDGDGLLLRPQSPSRFVDTAPVPSLQKAAPGKAHGLLHGLLKQQQFASHPNLSSLLHPDAAVQPSSSAAAAGNEGSRSAMHKQKDAADTLANTQRMLKRLHLPDAMLALEARFAAAKQSKSCNDLTSFDGPGATVYKQSAF